MAAFEWERRERNWTGKETARKVQDRGGEAHN